MKTFLQKRDKIKGLKEVEITLKVTEKIAAANFHFLRQKEKIFLEYKKELEKILKRFSLFFPLQKLSFFEAQNKKERKALLLIFGEKGLVGHLWEEIFLSFLKVKESYQVFWVIGKKGAEYFKEEKIDCQKFFKGIPDDFKEEEIKNIFDFILGNFIEGNVSQIDILYPKFKTLLYTPPTLSSFLPLKKEIPDLKEKKEGFPIFEGRKRKIAETIIKKYIEALFWEIIIETKLVELSKRALTLENARAKIEKIIENLRLSFFKERRKVLTQKQLESFMAHKFISKIYGKGE